MKKIFRLLIDIVLLMLLLLTVVIVGPNVFGIKTLVVVSGSMSPALPVGSLVYAVPASQEDIKIGDPISFVMDENGTVATHRVVAIDDKGRFTVKGDANDNNDPVPVLYENVIGVVRYSLPYVGFILSFVLTAKGRIAVFTGCAALVLLIFIFSETPEEKERKAAKKAEKKAKKAEKKSRRAGQETVEVTDPAAGDTDESVPMPVDEPGGEPGGEPEIIVAGELPPAEPESEGIADEGVIQDEKDDQ